MEFSDSELWDPATRTDPHPFYARVRAAGRPVPQIDPAGHRFWVIAGHADVLDGLQHPALGHQIGAHRDAGGAATRSLDEVARISSRQLIELDPPDHTRLRGLVSTAFTARTVARLEPWITEIADLIVDRAAKLGTFDGVADLADPLPVNVIAELIGIPEADRPRFRAWSAAIVSGSAAGPAATREFAEYIDRLAAQRRDEPRDDLLSGLIALEATGDGLDRDELVAMIQLLLIAGQETTVDLIVNAIGLLLTHPDQWDAVRSDPSLVPAAVEETLRYRGSVEIVPPRFTFGEVQLAGGTIPAHERVALSLWGANRDPAIFSNPDTFEIFRSEAGRHVAFGYGRHFCLGASLGRLEGRIMLERIVSRLPTLRLATDPAELAAFRLHGGGLALHTR